MKPLTDAQVIDIQSFLKEKLGNASALTDELLDHVCVLTEIEMQAGKPFEVARERAFLQLDKSVLQDIQKTEMHRKWADKRTGERLLKVIIGLIIVGLGLFLGDLRGFRIAWILALILTAYLWLPLTAFRRWVLETPKPFQVFLFLAAFIQLNSLIFWVLRLRLWRLFVPLIVISSVITLVVWWRQERKY
jgi:hypothetical protein